MSSIKIQHVIFIILIIIMIYQISCKDCYKKPYSKYIKSSHAGLIRGIIIGCISGNYWIDSAVSQGTTFAIINPVMKYIGY